MKNEKDTYSIIFQEIASAIKKGSSHEEIISMLTSKEFDRDFVSRVVASFPGVNEYQKFKRLVEFNYLMSFFVIAMYSISSFFLTINIYSSFALIPFLIVIAKKTLQEVKFATRFGLLAMLYVSFLFLGHFFITCHSSFLVSTLVSSVFSVLIFLNSLIYRKFFIAPKEAV